MMKRFLIFLVIIIFYVFAINLVAVELARASSLNAQGSEDFMREGPVQKVGLNAQVEVSVRRNRWYGVILESGDPRVSVVYIFSFLKLPLKSSGVNFVYFHAIFFFILVMMYMLLLILQREKKNKFINSELQ